MVSRASEPEGIGWDVSVGFAFEELLRDGVHDVRVLLVLGEESPDEGGQGGGGGVGLEDVLGSRDWHCRGCRGVVGWVWRGVGVYITYRGNATKPKVR